MNANLEGNSELIRKNELAWCNGIILETSYLKSYRIEGKDDF